VASANVSASQSLPARLSAMVNPVFRKGILLATHNRLVAKVVRRYGMRLGGNRFVAGEDLDQAVPVLRRLNEQGLLTNTTLLGEAVRDERAVAAVVGEYVRLLDRIQAEGLKTNIALKLTHLGLDLGEDVAYANVERLVAHAATVGNFIRIDMEESARVDPTLRIYRRLRAAGHDNVGAVLQSALLRTPADLESLLALKPNLRLVKGAYLESPAIAHQKKTDVDAAYVRLAERMLLENSFTAIATHDEKIIDYVISFAAQHGLTSDSFEIQMLYGIRSQYQLDLVRRGFRVLVASPYGAEWYFYLMRRLAERPANVMFLLRGIARR